MKTKTNKEASKKEMIEKVKYIQEKVRSCIEQNVKDADQTQNRIEKYLEIAIGAVDTLPDDNIQAAILSGITTLIMQSKLQSEILLTIATVLSAPTLSDVEVMSNEE